MTELRIPPVLHCAILVVVALCLALAGRAARAQEAGDDAPARVGRVALAQGDLYIAPQERAQEWAAVGLNHPVATGDNLWMSGEGRAEIDYGGGQFRLGPDSNVHVSRLDDAQVALFVAQGRIIVRVRALEPGETARIDTPNAQVELARPGLYRIDVSPEPRQTWVIVREGEADLVLPSGTQQVVPGQTATIAGVNSAVAEVRSGAGLDGLDAWSADRDRVFERGRASATYVSPQMVGYADLESHGRWQSYPEYGAVWFPATVVADWAPYRYGRWVWLSVYGWTWVDDAPWGYAPFHYGRWANLGGRWGWCPGTFVRRPVWAPALVAWYGGNGWSYSTSIGSAVFGWVPLGWRDPFVPWWGRCGSRCYDRYNRPYAVNVVERPRQPAFYANGRVPGAVTAVPAAALRETRPVQASRVALPAQGLANAPLLTRSPAVTPTVISTRVVQAGRGAPQPAGEIAARVRPQALSPFAGSGSPSPARVRALEGQTAQPVTAVPPASVGNAGPSRHAPVTAMPPAAVGDAGVPRNGPVTAVPPSQGQSFESPRRATSPTLEGRRSGEPMRRTPPESAPVVRQAPAPQPTERSVRAVPPAAMAPPPSVQRAPQAPLSAVPPAYMAPHAVTPPPPPPHARETPAPPRGREQPGQQERPNGPRQGQS